MAAWLVSMGSESEALSAERLFESAQNGDVGAVSFLCTAGAPKDKEHANGGTPLTIASQNGHLDVAQCLFDHGAY